MDQLTQLWPDEGCKGGLPIHLQLSINNSYGMGGQTRWRDDGLSISLPASVPDRARPRCMPSAWTAVIRSAVIDATRAARSRRCSKNGKRPGRCSMLSPTACQRPLPVRQHHSYRDEGGDRRLGWRQDPLISYQKAAGRGRSVADRGRVRGRCWNEAGMAADDQGVLQACHRSGNPSRVWTLEIESPACDRRHDVSPTRTVREDGRPSACPTC